MTETYTCVYSVRSKFNNISPHSLWQRESLRLLDEISSAEKLGELFIDKLCLLRCKSLEKRVFNQVITTKSNCINPVDRISKDTSLNSTGNLKNDDPKPKVNTEKSYPDSVESFAAVDNKISDDNSSNVTCSAFKNSGNKRKQSLTNSKLNPSSKYTIESDSLISSDSKNNKPNNGKELRKNRGEKTIKGSTLTTVNNHDVNVSIQNKIIEKKSPDSSIHLDLKISNFFAQNSLKKTPSKSKRSTNLKSPLSTLQVNSDHKESDNILESNSLNSKYNDPDGISNSDNISTKRRRRKCDILDSRRIIENENQDIKFKEIIACDNTVASSDSDVGLFGDSDEDKGNLEENELAKSPDTLKNQACDAGSTVLHEDNEFFDLDLKSFKRSNVLTKTYKQGNYFVLEDETIVETIKGDDFLGFEKNLNMKKSSLKSNEETEGKTEKFQKAANAKKQSSITAFFKKVSN